MSVVINTNVDSLKIQSILTNSTNQLSQSMQRMSSGMRILSAKDDAAGTVISARMDVQLNGNQTCQKNIQNANSMLSTAEGNIDVVLDNITRIRDLTLQAKNGTFSTEEKEAMQKEVDERILEINRVSDSAKFSQLKLFGDTSATGLAEAGITFQVGANETANDTIAIDASKGLFKSVNFYDIVTKNVHTDQTTTDYPKDVESVVYAANAAGVTAACTEANFTAKNIIFSEGNFYRVVEGEEEGTYEAEAVSKIIPHADVATVPEGISADGATRTLSKVAPIDDAVGKLYKDGDNYYVITAEAVNETDDSKKDYTFTKVDAGKITDKQTVTPASDSVTPIYDGDAEDDTLPSFDLSKFTAGDATVSGSFAEAIKALDTAIDNLTSRKSAIGSAQSRLASALDTLTTQYSNLTSAKSIITDADIASEASKFTQNQILQQVSTSLLAQANQAPSIALSLL